ncbi:MAG TPA: hypothetical protein VKR59_02105 [Terriglobales bacterium]|nr:hypothetical protein [Terriglobales bacterium]
MPPTRPFASSLIATAGAALAILFLFACQQSQQPSTPSSAQPAPAVAEKVFVVFEGPWALVADPKDANSVLALAPKTKSHRDLDVSASNESVLAAGTYDLSVPAHGPATSAPLDPSFAQAKIDAKSLQHALDDKSGRYVIRLPKPEQYRAARRVRSRVGASYPPDASTEQNYATEVSLVYTVSSLNGFSLAGTPDAGNFNPLLLQLESPTIRFAIEPAQFDDPKDRCSVHSREAFRDTAKFLGLTLYVDFPNDAADCHKADPQTPRGTKAQAYERCPLDRLVALFPEGRAGSQPWSGTRAEIASDRFEMLATIDGADRISRCLVAVAYFFRMTGIDCHAPIVFLTTTP